MILDKYIRSKSSFVLGLAIGIAIVSTLGFLVFGGLFVKERLYGTTSADDSEFAADGAADDANNDAVQPSDAAGKVDIKVASGDHIRGKQDAKITIVEYTDYQCPYCSRFHSTLRQVMEKYPNDVRWVLRHFPLESIHPFAKKAAMAAECANDQKKFWEYSDKIYENQAKFSDAYFETAAKELKLDTKKFNECLSSEKYASKVSADMQQGQGYGVQGTPGSFVNGQSVPGAVPFEQLESMIKPLL